ncbi:MAG: hypothetical protein A2Z07_00275 [Armatimonadetes bacterium RBG_16_67_12]|nr:MAG: hypothetical protein A2Z07_00275 [Armatimonadetes bacterium RBG_16_67_12]
MSPHIVRSLFFARFHRKNIVHITGRPVAAFAASMAITASSGTIMVSTANRSAPPPASAAACSAKLARRSSSDTSPIGA